MILFILFNDELQTKIIPLLDFFSNITTRKVIIISKSQHEIEIKTTNWINFERWKDIG